MWPSVPRSRLAGTVARLLAVLLAFALCGCSHQSTDLATVYDSPAETVAEVGSVGTMTQEDYPAGCEVVSMINALHTFGINLSFGEAYGMLDHSDWDFVHAWWGDPYIEGAAYPPAMVDALGLALADTEIDARDMTGETLEGFVDTFQAGGVVIAWVTTDGAMPRWTDWEVDGYRMYSNEHCVVAFDISDDGVDIMDPLSGERVIDTATFNEIWTACGSMAVRIS